jgi:P27 family predicted phage terminase small subunit
VEPVGRKPKPTALRIVESGGKMRTRYKDKARTEPVAKPGLPAAPEDFTAEQLSIWQRIEASAPPGLLTEVDGDLIVSYVVSLAARNECVRLFNKTKGAILVHGRDRGAPAWVTNPLLRELRRLNTDLLQMQCQLGYSPASRTRIAVQLKGDDLKDPLSRFFGAA